MRTLFGAGEWACRVEETDEDRGVGGERRGGYCGGWSGGFKIVDADGVRASVVGDGGDGPGEEGTEMGDERGHGAGIVDAVQQV